MIWIEYSEFTHFMLFLILIDSLEMIHNYVYHHFAQIQNIVFDIIYCHYIVACEPYIWIMMMDETIECIKYGYLSFYIHIHFSNESNQEDFTYKSVTRNKNSYFRKHFFCIKTSVILTFSVCCMFVEIRILNW